MLLNRLILPLLFSMTLLAQEMVLKQSCLQLEGAEYTLLRKLPEPRGFFLVNTKSLETSIHSFHKPPALIRCQNSSAYQNLRRAVLNEPKSITNRGLKSGYKDAYALTVDMCPSSKEGFELDFFETLIKRKEAFPVSISMTKKWALQHPEEFEMIKVWDDQKKLKITWINHGAAHPYKRHIPIEKNFINLKGVDFKKEVLDNENFLLQEGRVPSVFYRFAGLVSNDEDFNYLVKELGLIPLGSSAWLAKGEPIQKRSIVLIHGNKNEPLGIKLYLKSKNRSPVIGLPQLFSKGDNTILLILLKTPL